MSGSKIQIGILSLLACALLFLVLNFSERLVVFTSDSQIQNSEASSDQSTESEVANNQKPKTFTPLLKTQSAHSQFYEALRSNPFKRSAYREFCGDKRDQISNSIQKNLNLSELNPEQQLVFEDLLQKCEVWFDGDANGDWSASGLETMSTPERELADLMILQDSSLENTSIANEFLTSEDADLVVKSVAILLTRDEEFQKMVSKSTGSTSSAYAATAMGDILPLLACKLEGDCGAESATMIGFCLSLVDACNKNIYDFFLTIHSPNYVEDVSIMASAIYDARMSLMADWNLHPDD